MNNLYFIKADEHTEDMLAGLAFIRCYDSSDVGLYFTFTRVFDASEPGFLVVAEDNSEFMCYLTLCGAKLIGRRACSAQLAAKLHVLYKDV